MELHVSRLTLGRPKAGLGYSVYRPEGVGYIVSGLSPSWLAVNSNSRQRGPRSRRPGLETGSHTPTRPGPLLAVSHRAVRLSQREFPVTSRIGRNAPVLKGDTYLRYPCLSPII